jgi:hypothetical protein
MLNPFNFSFIYTLFCTLKKPEVCLNCTSGESPSSLSQQADKCACCSLQGQACIWHVLSPQMGELTMYISFDIPEFMANNYVISDSLPFSRFFKLHTCQINHTNATFVIVTSFPRYAKQMTMAMQVAVLLDVMLFGKMDPSAIFFNGLHPSPRHLQYHHQHKSLQHSALLSNNHHHLLLHPQQSLPIAFTQIVHLSMFVKAATGSIIESIVS